MYAGSFCGSMKKFLWLKTQSYTFWGYFYNFQQFPKHWNFSYREAFRDPFQWIKVILKWLEVFGSYRAPTMATLPKFCPRIQLPIAGQKQTIFHNQLLLGPLCIFFAGKFQTSGSSVEVLSGQIENFKILIWKVQWNTSYLKSKGLEKQAKINKAKKTKKPGPQPIKNCKMPTIISAFHTNPSPHPKQPPTPSL